MALKNISNYIPYISNSIRFLFIDNIKKIHEIRKVNNETKLNLFIHQRSNDCYFQFNSV